MRLEHIIGAAAIVVPLGAFIYFKSRAVPAPPSPPPPTTITIYGQLSWETGEPISHAYLMMYGIAGRPGYSTDADANGYYEKKVVPGWYLIVVIKDNRILGRLTQGYELFEVSTELNGVFQHISLTRPLYSLRRQNG